MSNERLDHPQTQIGLLVDPGRAWEMPLFEERVEAATLIPS